jgi:hypothetical protein
MEGQELRGHRGKACLCLTQALRHLEHQGVLVIQFRGHRSRKVSEPHRKCPLRRLLGTNLAIGRVGKSRLVFLPALITCYSEKISGCPSPRGDTLNPKNYATCLLMISLMRHDCTYNGGVALAGLVSSIYIDHIDEGSGNTIANPLILHQASPKNLLCNTI